MSDIVAPVTAAKVMQIEMILAIEIEMVDNI